MKAKISDIFESTQGEGIYQGIKQVFIRFYGCNLSCKFCDTKLKSYKEYALDTLFKKIDSFNGNYHSISLTGGEPLLQVDFLKEFLPRLKNKRIYLETNGTLPEELNKIIDMVDIISMDVKLPSSTGLRDFTLEHKRFLNIAFKKEVFIKAVICNSTGFKDIKQTIKWIRNLNRNIPFILQPNSFELSDILIKKIIKFRDLCLEYLKDVRVIPQLHKIIRVK